MKASSENKKKKKNANKAFYKSGTITSPHDLSIANHVDKVKEALAEDKEKQIYEIPFNNQNPVNYTLLQYIYSKPNKTPQDCFFIQHYLTVFSNLIKTIFKKKQMTDPKILLSKIAFFLNYEPLEQGTIICRYGDPGDKFYLIFKGKIAVIITREHKIKMNEKDYIVYLQYLFDIKEYELVLKTIASNISIYNSNEVYALRKKITEIQERMQEAVTKPKKGGNNEINLDVVPIAEYIQRSQPHESIVHLTKKQNSFEIIPEEEQINEIITWPYFQVAKLEETQTFGDVALSDGISKRTASIICIEDSSFGSLDIQIYKKCIRASQEIIRRMNIQTILSNPIFEGVSVEAFNRKYFNYFRLTELCLGDNLFEQGDERSEIYFLKEGEIQMLTSSSMNEINNIMESFGEENKNKKAEIKLLKSSAVLEKYFNSIQYNLKVVIYNSKNAIGLDDCMYKDRYFVTAKCGSYRAKVYALDFDIFVNMINVEKRVDKNISSYFPLRREIMLSRLKKIKEIFLFSKYNTINDEKDLQKDEEMNLKSKTYKNVNCKMTVKNDELAIKILSPLKNNNNNILGQNNNNGSERTKQTIFMGNEALYHSLHKKKISMDYFNEMKSNKFSLHKNENDTPVCPIIGNTDRGYLKLKTKKNSSISISLTENIHSNNNTNTNSNCYYTPNYNKTNPNQNTYSSKITMKLNSLFSSSEINSNKRLMTKNGHEDSLESTIGKYIGQSGMIQEKLKRKIGQDHTRNVLLKMKRELTEGFGLLSADENFNNKSTDSNKNIFTNENGLIMSHIDCLAFDQAVEKSQATKPNESKLKGKKIKLPRLKGRQFKLIKLV